MPRPTLDAEADHADALAERTQHLVSSFGRLGRF
jgi:hypothetical protein